MSSDSSSVKAAVLDAAALKKAQRDSLRAAKDAAREAKWARLDSLDAAKAKLAADKKAAKLRAKKLKQLKAIKAREAKENARLEKYKAAFAKKRRRKIARRPSVPPVRRRRWLVGRRSQLRMPWRYLWRLQVMGLSLHRSGIADVMSFLLSYIR